MKKLISDLLGWHVDSAILWLKEHEVKYAVIVTEFQTQDQPFKNADILIITNRAFDNAFVENIVFNSWT